MVALLLGIILLRGMGPSDEDSQAVRSSRPGGEAPARATTTRPGATTTTTTRPLHPPAEVKVLVLNASNVRGAGGRAADVVRRAGYNVLAPDNTRAVSRSTVEFAPGFDADAAAVAALLDLGLSSVQPLTSVANVRDANVVVFVGPDLAQSLPTASSPATSATATTRRSTTVTTRRTTTTSRARVTTTAAE